MNGQIPFFRFRLKEELRKRTEKNPRYSLRGFANALNMDPAALSRIISGKQPLALKSVSNVLQHLNLPEEEQELFINSVVNEKTKAGLRKLSDTIKSNTENPSAPLPTDSFLLLQEPQHLALLDLVDTHNFMANLDLISKKLGMTPSEAIARLDRLFRLGLITKTPDGYTKSRKLLDRQKQSAINSITMAIDPSKVEFAREFMAHFCLQLGEALKSTPNSHPKTNSKQYQVQVTLLPLEEETAND
jgi:uncharacterized protein (TIGR02147 family)